MAALRAGEALSQQVVRVLAEGRPRDLQRLSPEAKVYAVFAAEGGDSEPAPLLGLVTERQVACFPDRIFADLVGDHPPAPVRTDTLLDDVRRRMETDGLEAIPVLDARGAFEGAITSASLLTTLLCRAHAGVRSFPEDSQRATDLEEDQRRLAEWSGRLEQLQAASGTLLRLVARTCPEPELLQRGIEALVAVIESRYGAVAVLGEAGELTDFIYTGISPPEAQRIGRLPQGRGLLGAVLEDRAAIRLADLSQDPRAVGFPPHHPPMQSFLAAAIRYHGQAYGRIYLCDKIGGRPFTEEDERLASMFADALALVITNARAHAAVRASEERFRSVVEHISDIILILGPDGTIRYDSPSIERVLGYKPGAFLGHNVLELIHPADAAGVRRALENQEGYAPTSIECRARDREGSWHVIEAIGKKLGDQSAVAATVVTCRDITARKRAEGKLRTARDQLHHLSVHARQAREEQRSRLARELHDQLGQLLAGLKMDLSRLSKQLANAEVNAASASALCGCIDSMSRAIDAAVMTVRTIATELRPETPDKLSLLPAIERQLEDFERRTHIKYRFTPGPERLHLDRARSSEVFRFFQEALTNVARHSHATRLTVRVTQIDDGITLRVHDNGRGTAASDIDAPTSLGLVGMRERAALLGGAMKITGSPAKGTTVTLLLPLQGGARAAGTWS